MQIKFISLNLWEGGQLKENIIGFLQKEKPDLLFLQEAWQCTKAIKHIEIERLKRLLNIPYVVFAPSMATRENGKKIIWGNAILSKLPILDTHTTFFSGQYTDNYVQKEKGDFRDVPRNYLYAKIKAKGNILNAVNIHGIWDFHGEDNPKRLKMSETVIKEIRNKKHIILSGDFNTKPHTKSIRDIEQYLKNIFKGELTTSFNMKRKDPPGNYGTAVVDMTFVSPDIKIIFHSCPQVDISDHLPLVCQFEIQSG